MIAIVREGVEERILAPATAEYLRTNVYEVDSLGGTVIVGMVDASNMYGVPLRSQYGGYVKCVAGAPQVVYAWLDDVEWGTEFLRNVLGEEAAMEAAAAAEAAFRAVEEDEIHAREGEQGLARYRQVVKAQKQREALETIRRDSLQRIQESVRAHFR